MPLDATDRPKHGRRRTAGQGPTTAAAAVPPSNKASAVTQLIPPESLQLLHCTPRNFFTPMLASIALLPSPPPPQSRSLTVPAADRSAPAVENHCCCFCCCCCNAVLFTYKPLPNAPSGSGTQDSCLRFKWTPCLVQKVVSVQNFFFNYFANQRAHVLLSVFVLSFRRPGNSLRGG